MEMTGQRAIGAAMLAVVDTLGNGTATTNGLRCALATTNDIAGAYDACYDRGSTFRLKWFLNDLRHSLNKNRRKYNRPFFFRMVLVVYLEAMGFCIQYSTT